MDGVYPMYCFYNAWALPGPSFVWNCRTFEAIPQRLGCAVAPASSILELVNQSKGSFSDVAPRELPWSCLVCCQGFATTGKYLPDRVLALLHSISRDSEERETRLRPSPPSYVQSVLGGVIAPTGPDLAQMLPDISQVLIVTEGIVG